MRARSRPSVRLLGGALIAVFLAVLFETIGYGYLSVVEVRQPRLFRFDLALSSGATRA